MRNRPSKVQLGAIIVFLLLMGVGHLVRITDLWVTGRGQYRAALASIAEATEAADVMIAGDHDFRNSTVVAYHLLTLPTEKTFTYVHFSAQKEHAPEWYLQHSQKMDYAPKERIKLRSGYEYDLVEVFRYSGVSGWHWAEYRIRPAVTP